MTFRGFFSALEHWEYSNPGTSQYTPRISSTGIHYYFSDNVIMGRHVRCIELEEMKATFFFFIKKIDMYAVGYNITLLRNDFVVQMFQGRGECC